MFLETRILSNTMLCAHMCIWIVAYVKYIHTYVLLRAKVLGSNTHAVITLLHSGN